jgi:hypothetical protein
MTAWGRVSSEVVLHSAMNPGRRLLLACVAVYAISLVAAPLGHHDLLCHVRTPTHCTACVSSPPGSSTLQLKAPGARDLVDAGRAFTRQAVAETANTSFPSPSRAPPL